MNKSLVTKIAFGLVAFGILIGLPPVLNLGLQNAMNSMLIAALFAMGFNLLMGQGGMLSFGHAAHYGIGAFSVLHLMKAVEDFGWNIPTPLLPIAGGVGGLVIGVIVGYFASKRSGVYFSLVTLALAEMLHSLAPHWDGLFGGEAGLSSIRMPFGQFNFGSMLEVYYVTLFWVTLCILLLWAYTKTPFGRLTLALRDNEQRARFMGYNVHATKVIVFGISAMFSGVAGGLLAFANEVGNYVLFSTHTSALVVLHTFVGGSAVFFGPAFGAVSLTLFAFIISDLTRSWLLYQGVIFVLIMLYAPIGIGGLIKLHVDQWHRLNKGEMVRSYLIAAIAGASVTATLIFIVEICAEAFAPDHRPGELIPLWGTEWSLASTTTWALPLVMILVSSPLLYWAIRCVGRLWEPITQKSDGENPPEHS